MEDTLRKRLDQIKDWNLKIIGDAPYAGVSIPCKVPGTVYGTLFEAGIIPDPFYRDNELKLLPMMQNDFEFTGVLTVTEENLKASRLFLVFEGVDTVADIFLNGELLASVKNMHRTYRFSVKDRVREGANTLRVLIKSPTKYIKQENEKVYCGGSHDAMEGFPHLRKAHCMFGWDWGPRIPDAGFFRPVYLEEAGVAAFEDVKIKVLLNGRESAEVKVDHSLDTAVDPAFRVRTSLFAPNGEKAGEVVSPPKTEAALFVEKPELWWPNGLGSQPLYRVVSELLGPDGEVLDVSEKRIGIRTLTVNTDKDEWGNRFAHEVNGVRFFAMGADYIPEDSLFSRINRERTKKLLCDAVAANHNCIRVWGGGYYPDDFFFDLCDELGLVVWQDFMFACASYELDDDFDKEIRAEVRDNVRRLRHHACLGLWCGNNEMETQTLDGAWRPSVKQKADYLKIFEYIIPSVLKEEDPDRFYWPSSPSSCGNYDNPWDENRGDTHYWAVWHGNKPFTEYRKFRFRYLSEFGFQSFPDPATIDSFTEPADRNVFSRVMEMHQRNAAANGKILNYLSETYRYPYSFDRFVYFSQLLQAEAIRYGVEHFRRYRGRCMGSVVWQLNDIWPVSSWSSIDYYGNWKALHYTEKRMFAPVVATCEEHGEVDMRPHCIAEPGISDFTPSARFNVSNETFEEVKGVLSWEIRDAFGNKVNREGAGGGFELTVPAFSAVWTEEISLPEINIFNEYISFDFKTQMGIISNGTVLFTAPKHFEFEDPKIKVEQEGKRLKVTAERFAKNVEIRRKPGAAGASERLVLSDNFFDMNPGTRYIDILEGKLSVEDILVQSVFG
ncbi:MAG: glycoside hydrolase family 2 protein [Lachnospiraceae bacterium]|nr:glycoside hydrolase family 2 protein [Lachnospiraceae bacterium]